MHTGPLPLSKPLASETPDSDSYSFPTPHLPSDSFPLIILIIRGEATHPSLQEFLLILRIIRIIRGEATHPSLQAFLLILLFLLIILIIRGEATHPSLQEFLLIILIILIIPSHLFILSPANLLIFLLFAPCPLRHHLASICLPCEIPKDS
jgi:hypothetical protein